MLCLGLFFSVYFCDNSFIVISADNHPEAVLNHPEESGSLTKTTLFKFDPMARVKNSTKELKLARQEEKQKKLERERQENEPKDSQKQKYQAIIAGSPLEEMLPFISQCDNKTASFLIAIAKKESDWGKYSPKKDGHDCFNYWGYRGDYNQTNSGYSCFDSPEQAILVVGEKIRELIDKKIDTAQKMIIWKCGSTCVGHDPAGVRKWIADVALYYEKANS